MCPGGFLEGWKHGGRPVAAGRGRGAEAGPRGWPQSTPPRVAGKSWEGLAAHHTQPFVLEEETEA